MKELVLWRAFAVVACIANVGWAIYLQRSAAPRHVYLYVYRDGDDEHGPYGHWDRLRNGAALGASTVLLGYTECSGDPPRPDFPPKVVP